MTKDKPNSDTIKEVLVDGLKIIYQESGNDNKQNLLLLHGWGQSHSFWKDVINRYVSQYHIYAVDLPGFGLSQEPSTIWNLQKYAEFVQKFVNSFHISTPIIIGHSFGGRIASVYASTYPVQKLVLYSSGGLPRKSLKHKLYKHIFINFARYSIPNYLYKSHTTMFKPKNYYNKVIITRGRSQRMLNIYLQPSPNLKTFLEKIKIKTLIISGKKDYIVVPSMGQRLHKFITDSQLVEIPEATHFAHIESPKIFFQELTTFFEKI